MLQPSLNSATSLRDRLRTGAGRRALALGLTLLIEGLLLFVLLSFRPEKPPVFKERRTTVVQLDADVAAEEDSAPSDPEQEPQAEQRPVPEPPAMVEPLPLPPVAPKAAPPAPVPVAVPPQPQATAPSSSQPSPKPRRVYGPPNKGGSAASRDTELVGTAPNGEPLYAAAWYREPTNAELRPYLSTARGPGWGLIACKTAPDFRVEDCVGLGEYPEGSQITRAVLAAAWEFKVRPPRRGGQVLVGSWVRIRIDYGIERR